MQKASERAPHNHALQCAYSVDLSKAGRLEEAEAVLAKVALVMPADGNVVLHKARLQYQRSEYTAATDTLVELVRRQPRPSAGCRLFDGPAILDGIGDKGRLFGLYFDFVAGHLRRFQ
jgi:Flp pilus assembly protein TadD